jgi:hypothetical protein
MKKNLKAESLEIIQDAKDNGVISGRGILIDKHTRFLYLVIDPEKVNHEYLQKEAKNFWLLYINKNVEDKTPSDNANDTIPEKSIS